MSKAIRAYVEGVDRMNRFIGRASMYLVFVLVGVLIWSSLAKTFFNPAQWTLETAQFVMVAYYVLGGPYSIQLGSNVRMDLFYGRWSPKTKAWVEAVTVLCLMYYLVVLLVGAVGSTAYALGYFGTEPFAFFRDLLVAVLTGGPEAAASGIGHLERSSTAWRPALWPIKVTLCIGVFLMILQVSAEFFRSVGKIREGES